MCDSRAPPRSENRKGGESVFSRFPTIRFDATEEIELPSLFDLFIADILEYGQRLGIDLQSNPGLGTLVRDWILQPLPRYWYPW